MLRPRLETSDGGGSGGSLANLDAEGHRLLHQVFAQQAREQQIEHADALLWMQNRHLIEAVIGGVAVGYSVISGMNGKFDAPEIIGLAAGGLATTHGLGRYVMYGISNWKATKARVENRRAT